MSADSIVLEPNERLLLIYLLTNTVGFDKRGSCHIDAFCNEKSIDRRALLGKVERSLAIGVHRENGVKS